MKSFYKVLGLLVCLFANIFRIHAGKDYLISLLNEKIFTPCKDHPNNFLDRIFDFSKFKFQFNDDDTVFVDGTLDFLPDIPKTQLISGSADVYKKQRGQWVSTVYNLRRDDICRSVFNPAEFWYKYTSAVPEEDRECPPKKGMVYNVTTLVDPKLTNMEDRNGEGDYMVQLSIKYGPESDDYVCFNILFSLSRL